VSRLHDWGVNAHKRSLDSRQRAGTSEPRTPDPDPCQGVWQAAWVRLVELRADESDRTVL